MKEQQAFDLLADKYGIIRAAQLMWYAQMLDGMGAEHFDRDIATQQNRSKVIRQMRDAGVYWDDIEWTGYSRWWVRIAQKYVRSRRTATR